MPLGFIDYSIDLVTHGIEPVTDQQAAEIAARIGWDNIRSLDYGMVSGFIVDGGHYALNVQGTGGPTAQVYVFSEDDPQSLEYVKQGLRDLEEIRKYKEQQAKKQAEWWEGLLAGLKDIGVTAGLFVLGGIALYAYLSGKGKK